MITTREYKPKVRRVPHVDTPTVPERWIIHQRRDTPSVWIGHPVTPHCQARGESECQYRAANSCGGANGRALAMIQRVADQTRQRRLTFLARMRARGRFFS